MRYGLLSPILLTLLLAGLYGCGDEVTDPDAFLESEEAEAVMQSADQLPLLPTLLAEANPESGRDEAVLVRAQELWAAGSVDDERASARRRLAVRYALPVLTESLTDEQWATARQGVEEWLGTVEALMQRLALPGVEDRAVGARRYLAWSEERDTDQTRSRYFLLLAMSDLVETTPRYVALRLVREARSAVEGARGAGSDSTGTTSSRQVPERTLARAERLKDWADRAVAEEDYLLAIQRAYYAIQLVEGS